MNGRSMKLQYSPHWKAALISPEATIRRALRAINESGGLVACVTSSAGKLIGILTDSDIRRLLLSGISLDATVEGRFNANPVIAHHSASPAELEVLCEERRIRELPICDDDGAVVDLFVLGRAPVVVGFAEQSPAATALPNAMFISAGGRGTRLRSVVHDRPKPLAEVGGRPILETIIQRAAAGGIRSFFVSVNHMSEMIEEHLRQEQYASYQLQIVREDQPLGTAGAIGLIADEVRCPLMVSNADVLTTVPYERILRFHERRKADVTCVVRPHEVAVPFGVLDIQGNVIVDIREKPTFTYFVNAGIYVLSPAVCQMIGRNQRVDMPELILRVTREGGKACPFLLHEYWVDVGHPEDYRKANDEFVDHFGE